ncbi:MAG: response regulator [Gammaproteobacteria bacterium]|nr:response regulator [Gammaproteobacteria bacterium]
MNPTSTFHILHLEDDPFDAELIQRAVADAKIPYELLLVESRAQFLSKLHQNKFDVILSDNRLPDIDGIEALALVRQNNDTTPFVFVSGWADDPEYVQRLKSLGATGFITKADLPRVTAWLQNAYQAKGASTAAATRHAPRATRHEYMLERFIGVVQELSLARTLAGVHAIVCSAARNLTGADGATFVLRDGADCFYAGEDAISPLWKGQRFPMSACISGWAMQHRQAVAIEDIYADHRIPHDNYRPTFVKSLVMVPIRTREPLGAIGTYWAQLHVASAEEIKILQALADTTSVALENVQVYTTLEQRVAARTADLEAANKELESFTYAVSHDLRAPLRHIDGFAYILLTDSNTALNETSRQYLERIGSAAQRMGRLIDDLLKLSRTARIELQSQRFDFSALVSDVVTRIRDAHPERQVQLRVAENMQATGDRRLLEIVMENLLSNAWKFSGGTPLASIEVGITRTDDGASAYFVRDNGVGFSMTYAGKLFGAFQRLHSEQDFPGTGIGLATVQRIINRHRGKVWASAEVNQGACFYFTLGAESAVSI